jgi:hypothetical protein
LFIFLQIKLSHKYRTVLFIPVYLISLNCLFQAKEEALKAKQDDWAKAMGKKKLAMRGKIEREGVLSLLLNMISYLLKRNLFPILPYFSVFCLHIVSLSISHIVGSLHQLIGTVRYRYILFGIQYPS